MARLYLATGFEGAPANGLDCLCMGMSRSFPHLAFRCCASRRDHRWTAVRSHGWIFFGVPCSARPGAEFWMSATPGPPEN